VTVPSRRR